MLASTLAFVKTFASASDAATPSLADHDSGRPCPPGNLFPQPPGTPASEEAPQVWFLAPTHLQLTQALREMRASAYGAYTPCTVLAGRDRTCINTAVRENGRTGASEACLELLENENCRFRATAQLKATLPPVFDIEDLMTAGSDTSCCPYFAARELQPNATVVFATHAHLIGGPTSLSALGRDTIVIIDEAHRLLPQLESAASWVSTTKELTSLSETLKALHRQPDCPAGLEEAATEAAAPLQDVADWASQVMAAGASAHVQTATDWLACVLKVDPDQYAETLLLLRAAPTLVKPAYQRLQELAATLKFMSTNPNHFEVIVQQEGAHVNVELICLSPAPAWNKLLGDARSVILASATLGSIDTISKLIGHQIRCLLRAQRFLQPTQVECAVVTTCLDNVPIRCKASDLLQPAIQDRLGCAVTTLVAICPASTLVVFPSKSSRDATLTRWQQTGALGVLQPRPVIVAGGDATWDIFKAACESGQQPVLVMTARSRFGEGADFANDLARLVVIIGVPYADTSSEAHQARMRYQHRLGIDAQASQLQDAMTVVAQVLGRGVRAADDWCGCALIDSRFAKHATARLLPRWLTFQVGEVPTSSAGALARLHHFFSSRLLA